MKKPYKKARMTNWFQPSMLLNVASKAVISGAFGNYADRRELQAALSGQKEEHDLRDLRKRFSEMQEETWVDFICDTGDGFNSTFSVAKKAAEKQLTLTTEEPGGETHVTRRGDLLILGGDEVYPYPTHEIYTNKFRIPFSAAGAKEAEGEEPLLFAIPGNHDWYDGLGNFMKLFCQQRTIGLWKTFQRRSYFAIPLAHDCWIWATDIQLNSDIDRPQLEYFERIADQEMKEGDRILLVTAEPAWVYNVLHKNDQSFERLGFFISRFFRDNAQKTGKRFKLALTITGDLHHYSRYCRSESGHQYLTSGGGGAFLTLTHGLPDALNPVSETGEKQAPVTLRKTYPSKSESIRLLFGNLLFPVKNRAFTALTWLIWLYVFWLFQSHKSLIGRGIFFAEFEGVRFTDFVKRMLEQLLGNPSIALSLAAMAAGFILFTDTTARKRGTFLVGCVHAACQLLLLFTVIHCFAQTGIADAWRGWADKSAIIALFCFSGGTLSALLMGLYLFLSNLLMGMHLDEASSALAHPHFKNFVRLKIHADGITVYPIGIRKVQENWTVTQQDDDEIAVTGDDFTAALIEAPVTIRYAEL